MTEELVKFQRNVNRRLMLSHLIP